MVGGLSFQTFVEAMILGRAAPFGQIYARQLSVDAVDLNFLLEFVGLL